MKTAICDFCHRTKESIENKRDGRLRRFKASTWTALNTLHPETNKFDICDKCIHELSHRMQIGESNGKEN